MAGPHTCENLNARIVELERLVTRTKGARDSLAWEHIFTENTLDCLPAGLAYYNQDFVLLKCNRAYADLLAIHTAFDCEQALGMCYFDYKPGVEAYALDWFRHVRDSGRPDTRRDIELRWQGRDGGPHVSYWDVYLAPMSCMSMGNKGLLMCCADKTEWHTIRAAAEAKDPGLASELVCNDDLKKALRAVLELREEDRTSTEHKLVANARQMLAPWIDKLKQSCLDLEQQAYLKIIESNLTKLTSQFSQRLSTANSGLTPTEIQVCNLVEQGKTSKEIADLMRVSKACVDFHRNNIRKKLGLSGKRADLKTYLATIGR